MSYANQPGELLRAYGLFAKKRFGQHFLTDSSLLRRISDLAELEAGDRVLEIGPGCGTLTVTLLDRGALVTAVELDRDAAQFLRTELVPEHPALNVVEGDALAVDFAEILGGHRHAVVANLPYNVATPILFRLLESGLDLGPLVLMFQKEVADRIVAEPGTKKYGGLSVKIAMWAEAKLAMKLKPGAFTPPPAVDSAVVVLTPRSHPSLPTPEARRQFERTVTAAFAQRRKTIRNSLQSMWSADAVDAALPVAAIDPRIRAERLAFDDFVRLAAALAVEDERQ